MGGEEIQVERMRDDKPCVPHFLDFIEHLFFFPFFRVIFFGGALFAASVFAAAARQERSKSIQIVGCVSKSVA